MYRSGWCKAYALSVAIGTAIWWVLLLSNPWVRSYFLWPGFPDLTLTAFLPADIVFFIVLPMVWAVRPTLPIWNAHRFGVHYATLTSVTLCFISRGAWLGGALMAAASIGAEFMAQEVRIPRGVIEAKPSNPRHNLAKTAGQVVVMWGVFLFLLPEAVSLVDRSLGLAPMPKVAIWIPIALFCAAGSLGLYSASLFASHGRGTPLPLDATTCFVVMGPYRVIRNPMAAAGIFQGTMSAVMLQSWLALGYAVAGGFAWHYLARPWEEADLVARFGDDYVRYRAKVHNWVPTLKPYPTVLLNKVAILEEQGASCETAENLR